MIDSKKLIITLIFGIMFGLAIGMASCSNQLTGAPAASPSPTPSAETPPAAPVTVSESAVLSMAAGDTSAELVLDLSWTQPASSSAQARALTATQVAVKAAKLLLVDADGSPYSVDLSGTYDTASHAVAVSGTAFFKATTSGSVKEYTIAVNGTYQDGSFTGTVKYTELQASGTAEVIDGAASGQKSTTSTASNAAVRLSYDFKSDNGNCVPAFQNKFGRLVIDGSSFTWAGGYSGGGLETARGTAVLQAGTYQLTCTGIASCSSGGVWSTVPAGDYRAELDISGTPVLRIFEIPTSNTSPAGKMTVTVLPKKVAVIAGTWAHTTDSTNHGTFYDLVFFDNGKMCVQWKGTTSVTLGPCSGGYTYNTADGTGTFSVPNARYRGNDGNIYSISLSSTFTATSNAGSISITGTSNDGSATYSFSGTGTVYN